MPLDHKHIIITATVKNPPRAEDVIIDWMRRLVTAVDMKIIFGPYAKHVDNPGVEGVTAVVCIETSHSSIHVWDETEVPYLKFDLYSCKTFDPAIPIKFIQEFQPYDVDWVLFDRNSSELVEIGRGKESYSYGCDIHDNLPQS